MVYNSSYSYTQIKETGFFDVLSEQWLTKYLPVNDLFISNVDFMGKQSLQTLLITGFWQPL